VAPLPRRGTEVAGREHGWRLRSSNSVGNSICVTDSRWRWSKTRLAEEREAVLAAAAMGAWRPEQRQSSARRDDARGGDRQWGGEEVGLLAPTRGVARLLSYFVVWASKEFCRAQVGKNIYVSIFELFFPKDRRENELTLRSFFLRTQKTYLRRDEALNPGRLAHHLMELARIPLGVSHKRRHTFIAMNTRTTYSHGHFRKTYLRSWITKNEFECLMYSLKFRPSLRFVRTDLNSRPYSD
jgi:hypothetical protein